jgi:endogenous inhibitor of DNA gyrase (YacG/DUF329 family)
MNFKCPICRKPVTSEGDPHFPFCSEACCLRDLGNWAAERYVISEPALEEPSSPKATDEHSDSTSGNSS